MKKILIFLAMIVTLSGSCWAQDVKVFLNNRAFKGKVSGAPTDLMLEGKVVLQMLELKVEMPAPGEKLHLDEDKDVDVTDNSGTSMIRAKDLVGAFGGKYDYNKGLGVVDVYAYDPVAAARKALIAILKQRKITADGDFQVCVMLTQQVLVQQLGLKLDVPSKILFCTEQEMAKAGAGSTIGCLVTYTGERKGDGTGDYKFYVRKGESAPDIITNLAWSWGLTWANLRGLAKQEKYSVGFAYWTSYQTLHQLTGITSDAPFLRRAKESQPVAVDGFKELREMDKLGGIESVLKFIKDKGAL